MKIIVFYSSFITAKLRFFVMLLIPLSIFIGTALDYFRKKFNPSYLPILIIVLVLMFMYAYPFLSYRHEASSEKESAIFISATTEGNAIIFDAGDSGVFYDYYTDRKIVSCLYANKEKEFDEKIMLINNALKRSIPVYMSSQCFSLAKGEDTKFDVLWSTLRQDYQFAEVGKVYKENPESVVIADPKEYIIYKLRIKS